MYKNKSLYPVVITHCLTHHIDSAPCADTFTYTNTMYNNCPLSNQTQSSPFLFAAVSLEMFNSPNLLDIRIPSSPLIHLSRAERGSGGARL
ncbi:hypothetical protein GDO81_023604 [Engystomops pustulosus]|uniref:Uncharacterized protein n=1 Tax=Engystomops pustulosus TaxID=76066 RepID=A0AAV6YQ98_ENGPU|nr:hypothetical protein GDO81_023604 [Engystomops pustulosus]